MIANASVAACGARAKEMWNAKDFEKTIVPARCQIRCDVEMGVLLLALLVLMCYNIRYVERKGVRR